ncbi:MAG: lamin tail domain-containing protein [Euryarchaeota archaeon]|nr:lamin tail domain-containing protein [Euryarchaeota archaeon]
MFNRNRSLKPRGSSPSERKAQVRKESYVKVGVVTLALLFLATPIASAVLITEIMYDLPGADKGLEWIEVHNPCNDSINLTGWMLYEQGTKHRLQLVQGDMTLWPLGCAIIVDKPEKWLEAHKNYTGTVIDSAFSLKNKAGEYIAIINRSLDIQHNVSYTSELGANGNGLTLLLNATSDLLYEGSVMGGTPGVVDGMAPPDA